MRTATSLTLCLTILLQAVPATPAAACGLLDWLFQRDATVQPTIANYPMAQPAATFVTPGVVMPMAAPTAVVGPTVMQRPAFQTVVAPVPVTAYRPVGGADAALSFPSTVLRPCATTTWQTQRVPYGFGRTTAFRPSLFGQEAQTSYYAPVYGQTNYYGNAFPHRSYAVPVFGRDTHAYEGRGPVGFPVAAAPPPAIPAATIGAPTLVMPPPQVIMPQPMFVPQAAPCPPVNLCPPDPCTPIGAYSPVIGSPGCPCNQGGASMTSVAPAPSFSPAPSYAPAPTYAPAPGATNVLPGPVNATPGVQPGASYTVPSGAAQVQYTQPAGGASVAPSLPAGTTVPLASGNGQVYAPAPVNGQAANSASVQPQLHPIVPSPNGTAPAANGLQPIPLQPVPQNGPIYLQQNGQQYQQLQHNQQQNSQPQNSQPQNSQPQNLQLQNGQLQNVQPNGGQNGAATNQGAGLVPVPPPYSGVHYPRPSAPAAPVETPPPAYRPLPDLDPPVMQPLRPAPPLLQPQDRTAARPRYESAPIRWEAPESSALQIQPAVHSRPVVEERVWDDSGWQAAK